MRLAACKIPFPDISVPSANACGVDRDQHFTGINCRHRQRVRGDHLGSTEAVDRRGEHRARHMRRVMSGGIKMAGTIEHDNNLPAGVPAAWTRFLAAALTLVNFADQMRDAGPASGRSLRLSGTRHPSFRRRRTRRAGYVRLLRPRGIEGGLDRVVNALKPDEANQAARLFRHVLDVLAVAGWKHDG